MIEPGDDVSAFRCGHPALDEWLVTHAKRNQGIFCNTHVALMDGRIVGYLAVMSKHVRRDALGGSGPEEWPVLLIGRLAVATTHQDAGVGKALLRTAFQTALQQSLIGGGCIAVTVDAKLDTDPPADGYYAKFGFKRFKNEPAVLDPDQPYRRMYLRLKNVETLLAAWAEKEAHVAARDVAEAASGK